SFSTPQKVNNFTSIVWHFRFCQFVFCMNLFFIFVHLAADSLKLMTVPSHRGVGGHPESQNVCIDLQ
ncbi:MAG: hypothetical protein IIY93_00920, partial [Clostridia bacterium]|nr:hypothetical protein [Clostridia bacterium]